MMSSAPFSFGPRGSEALAFRVGQDCEGRWLAVETHGLGGGLFATREAALHYARAETGRRMDAIILTPEPLTLG